MEFKQGPQTWARKFSKAKGQHQSPINIETNQTLFNPALLERPLKIVYDTNSCSIIKNTGHSFQVDGHTKNHTSLLPFFYQFDSELISEVFLSIFSILTFFH